MVEYFPVIDEDGNVIDRATRQECHNGSKILHAAVHLHVFNKEGDLYMQKRADWKDIQPERLFNYIWESPREREMIYVHRITYDGEPQPDHSEVVDGRFWKISEIEESLGKDVFTPNFELDFKTLKEVGAITSK